MRKKHKMFPGFVIMVIMAIVTILECKSGEDNVTFPSSFIRTWERADLAYPHTLTFTSRNIRASNQSSSWELISISDDSYSISRFNTLVTIHLKLVGDDLEIIDDYDGKKNMEWFGPEDFWSGTWKRK